MGLIFIIIGVTFLLQNLGYIPDSARGIIWPAILIVFGIRLLFKKNRGGFFWEEEFGWRKKKFPPVTDQPRTRKMKKKKHE